MQRVARHRIIALAVWSSLLAATGTGARAQAIAGGVEALPAEPSGPAEVCPYTYDQWHMPLTRGGGNFTAPWLRPARGADAEWARTDAVENFVHVNHIRPYITMSTDEVCPEHVIRWLQEGLAYGDVIVPLAVGGEPRNEYFVTYVGTRRDWVETYIRDRFLSYEGPELENIIAALDTVDRDAIAADLAAEAAALPQLTYEEWRGGVDRDGRPILWSHDEPLAVRAERNAALYAAYPLNHTNFWQYGRGLYAFIDVPPGPGWTTNEAYRARWLLEAIEGGDMVVPIANYRPGNMFRFWQQPPLRYAVFAAGLPREAIEEQLARTLRFFYGMFPDDIPAIIQTYRLLAGPP